MTNGCATSRDETLLMQCRSFPVSVDFRIMASWEAALLEDAQTGEMADATDDADEYREISEDESDSQKTPSSQSDVVENSDSKWWWVSVLREAVEAVTGNTLCSSFPQRPLRVLSCCTGCSAESEVLKAGFGLGSRGLSPYCLASLESSDTSGEQKPEPERKSLIPWGLKP